MRNSGTISLFSSDGNLLKEREYFTIGNRRLIFRRFEEMKIEGSYIQINLQPLLLRYSTEVTPDAPKEPMKRFPGVYDNNKSLYNGLNTEEG